MSTGFGCLWNKGKRVEINEEQEQIDRTVIWEMFKSYHKAGSTICSDQILQKVMKFGFHSRKPK